MTIKWGGRGLGHTSRWPKKAGPSVPSNALLLENGSYLLLESGSKIVKEA